MNYSVRDYEQILHENLETIDDTKKKFQNYREMVKSRVQELEETNINVRRLSPKEEEKLRHLREIEWYLNRAIDEHQKILGSHLDLKALYTRELEDLTRMSLIRRFSLRTELYDKLLENPAALEELEYFLRPLFNQDAEKVYNLNKAFQLQRPVRRQTEEDTRETIDFDEEAWEREQERLRREKLKRYEQSLTVLLEQAVCAEKGEITLEQVEERTREQVEFRDRLIPNVEIFKEIMVELIRNREMELDVLRKERSQFIQDQQEIGRAHV